MTIKQKQTIQKLKNQIEKIKSNRKQRRKKLKEEKKDSREIIMIENWIKTNNKKISIKEFFMIFEKLYRLEFKKIKYEIKNLNKLKTMTDSREKESQ